MPHQCPHCSRQFPSFAKLRGHVLGAHKEEGMAGVTAESSKVEKTETVESRTVETIPVSELLPNMPEVPTEAEVMLPEEEPVDDVLRKPKLQGRSATLFRLLVLHNFPRDIALKASILLQEQSYYQDSSNLMNYLITKAPKNQADVLIILREVFPESSFEMPSSPRDQYTAFLERIASKVLDTLDQKTPASNGDQNQYWMAKYLELMQESYKNMVQQVTTALAAKQEENAQLKDKIENLSPLDFENRTFNALENNVGPAVLSELQHFRKMAEKALDSGAIGGAREKLETIARGPISAAEGEKLANVMNIREQMRQLASRGNRFPRQPEYVPESLPSRVSYD